MPVITLTTEWRPDDIYNGIIRGKLCRLCPSVSIVDNACNIPAFNISHASFVVRNTFSNYPDGTIHILCVHSEPGKESDCLVVKAKGHYFIGTDNGIFNLILNGQPDEIVRIAHKGINDELEVFARAAAGIISGKEISELGRTESSISEHVPLRATIEKDVIIGSIIFIDSYGNAISNITREVFARVFEGRSFRILIQSNKNYTDRIVNRYGDVPVGDLLAKFNSLDLLEIAINGENIAELLSISVGSAVRIDTSGKPKGSDKLF